MGFAWFYDSHWFLEKSVDPIVPTSYQPLHFSEFVMGHLRNKGKCLGEKSYVNTHPFQWQSFLFCQNGFIDQFKEHESLLASYLSPPYQKQRQGNTDSELLFYLLLSFYDDSKYMKNSILTLSILIKDYIFLNLCISNHGKTPMIEK